MIRDSRIKSAPWSGGDRRSARLTPGLAREGNRSRRTTGGAEHRKAGRKGQETGRCGSPARCSGVSRVLASGRKHLLMTAGSCVQCPGGSVSRPPARPLLSLRTAPPETRPVRAVPHLARPQRETVSPWTLMLNLWEPGCLGGVFSLWNHLSWWPLVPVVTRECPCCPQVLSNCALSLSTPLSPGTLLDTPEE